ncbi:MAG: hypothetical protein ACRBFS_26100 [Aureispira sp.]
MRILFLVMLMGIACVELIAQSPESKAEAVAEQFCTCVNTTYSNIDADVKTVMGRVVSYQLQKQPQDLERYMKRLPAELVIRVQEQAVDFKKNGALAQRCVHVMESEMEAVDLANPIYEEMTEDNFSRLIQKKLKEDTSCEFAALLLELGLREQPKDQQVRIGQTRSKETAGAATSTPFKNPKS